MSTEQPVFYFFFFNDTATTEIYTLSLHDALPILPEPRLHGPRHGRGPAEAEDERLALRSEEHRLNSSHGYISYAVFCLKKKKKPSTWCTRRLCGIAPSLAPRFVCFSPGRSAPTLC